MFLLNELIFFSPLVVYVYIRVLRMISRTAGKVLWTAAFLFLLLAFPTAESLSHQGVSGGMRYAMIAGYDAWPLLLYLVLAVVFADILVGSARLLRVLSRERAASPRFRTVYVSLVLFLPILVVIGGILNHNHLRIKNYSIEVPRKSSSLTELTIAFASDFHLGDRTRAGFLDTFVAKVNALEPDLVLIGGDVLEGDRREEDLSRYEAQFRRIRAKYGVYGVPGNHERYAGGREDFFAKAGIRLLQDEVLRIDDAFYLAGRNDARSRSRKPVADLLEGTPNDLPVILLDHRPTDLENASRTIADIQLSGHTHHGQLFPVNFITRHRYELSWGYKKKNRTHVFVTSGVQLWGPPVRTAGRSEILSIRVALRGPDETQSPGRPAPPPAGRAGCTAFVFQGRGALYLARNLDGPIGDGMILVNKKGVAKEAFGAPDAAPLRWTSKYGSVTFNQLGREFPLGGLNETGLAVEELGGPAAYPEADGRPALNELQWIQYQLDTARSVKEVLASDKEVRISKLIFDVHYLVADRKGNAAVVEFTGGKMASVSGGYLTVPVLSNNAYAESVRYLGFHVGFGGDRSVSKGPEPSERFVRAAAFLKEFESLGQAPFVDDAFVALKAVEQDDTQWSIAYNLPRRLVFFKTKAHRRYKIIALDRLDLSCRTPARILSVDTEASWDLAGYFADYDPEQNRLLLESVVRRLAERGEIPLPPSPDVLRAMAAYPDACRCK